MRDAVIMLDDLSCCEGPSRAMKTSVNPTV